MTFHQIIDNYQLDDYLIRYIDPSVDQLFLTNKYYSRTILRSRPVSQLVKLKIKNDPPLGILYEACENKLIETVKYFIYKKSKNINSEILQNAIISACKYNSAEPDSNCNMSIKIVDWLIKYGNNNNLPVDIHYNNDEAFRFSCQRGDLESAKWLIGYSNKINSKININARDEYAFRYACFNGHLEVAKWLVEYGKEIDSPIDIHADRRYAMYRSFHRGQFKVVEWLHGIMYGGYIMKI